MLRSPSTKLMELLHSNMFVWSDPAEPLLSHMRHAPGVALLESKMPCTVPHIAITEPAPDDGWAAWKNAVPEQNDANGNLLSLAFVPRSTLQSVAEEEWYTSVDMHDEYFSDSDYTFDDFEELPSPDRAEAPASLMPPPYTAGPWYQDMSASFEAEKDQQELVEVMLSPTAGPRMPIMLLIGGVGSMSCSEFPSPIDLDTLLSPEGILVQHV
jgi:hypothetical protein